MNELLDKLVAWENDLLTGDETVALFQELVDSGIIFQLQGTYQRTAQALADAGLITVSK